MTEVTNMGGTPIDHMLLIFTIFGTVTVGAYTASHEDCKTIEAAFHRAVDLHNQELPKRYKKVEVMTTCVKAEKD